MMVTEGGGAGSFGAAGGFGMAGGGPASFCAQEAPTAVVAKATAIKMNRRLARIRPPELLRDPNGPRSKVQGPSLALPRRSVRWNDRDLDLAACSQDLQRDLVAMAAHHKVDA